MISGAVHSAEELGFDGLKAACVDLKFSLDRRPCGVGSFRFSSAASGS